MIISFDNIPCVVLRKFVVEYLSNGIAWQTKVYYEVLLGEEKRIIYNRITPERTGDLHLSRYSKTLENLIERLRLDEKHCGYIENENIRYSQIELIS